jgi:hypothetical protein
MLERGLSQAIPDKLRIVVGVGIDEAGRHHQAAGFDDLAGVFCHRAHCDDPPIADSHVAAETGRAAAVADQAASDHQIKHVMLRVLF